MNEVSWARFQDDTQTKALLRTKEVAARLHINENTVRRWSERGILKAYRIGRRGDRRFLLRDVNRVLTVLRKNSGDGGTVKAGKKRVA